MLLNLQRQTGFNIKAYYCERVDTELSLFSLLLAFYYAIIIKVIFM